MSRVGTSIALLVTLAAGGAAAGELRIVATDEGYEAPATVPAGLRHIVFTNRGSRIHEAMLIQLAPGTTANDYLAAVHRGELFPAGALDASGPGLLSPGETTELWRRIDPGNYILLCWNHSLTSHFHAFDVVDRGSADDTPPPTDVVVRLVDYRFELSRPIHRGIQVLRFETDGPSLHEADLFRLLEGKSARDLVDWRAKDDPALPPPVVALGGALDSHDLKRPVWLRRTFEPGRYVLMCELPISETAKGGTHFTTHAEAGMTLSFEVGE